MTMSKKDLMLVAFILIVLMAGGIYTLAGQAEFENEHRQFFPSKEGYVVEVEFIKGVLFDETIIH